jgi:hypothetical protein
VLPFVILPYSRILLNLMHSVACFSGDTIFFHGGYIAILNLVFCCRFTMNVGFFMGVDLELPLMIILVLAQVQIGGVAEEGVCNL